MEIEKHLKLKVKDLEMKLVSSSTFGIAIT